MEKAPRLFEHGENDSELLVACGYGGSQIS